MMKELIDMNKQVIEESTKNKEDAPKIYENTFTAFVKKWAWRINNIFSGISLSTYGIIGCVIGYLLYKFGVLGFVSEYIGYGLENLGLIMQGKNDLINFVKDTAIATKNTLLGFASSVGNFFDHSSVKTVDEYNKRSLERINLGNLMISKLYTDLGYANGFMSLVANNIDHFIFTKDPVNLLKLCDEIGHLKQFDIEKCKTDVITSYKVLHSEFPDIYDNLLDPGTFNTMLSTVNDKMLITNDYDPYKNVTEIPDLQKYLLNNTLKPYSLPFNNIEPMLLPIQTQNTLDKQYNTNSFVGIFGLLFLFIYMIKFFLNLGNKAIQKYTTKKQELPLTNNDIIEEVEGVNEINSATKGLSEEVDSEINSATYDNEDASTQIIDMEQQDESELRKRN